MAVDTSIILLALITLISCTGRVKSEFDFKNNLDKCGDATESHADFSSYKLTDLEFRLTKDWRVRRYDRLRVIECVDTVLADKESKIRTFVVHEFESQKTDLLEYYKSELEIMKGDSIQIIEYGTKPIGGNESYYVITKAMIDTVSINQVFFYTDFRNKRYTIQIAMTETKDPVNELCKSMWIVKSINLTVE
jgi:hypothetical protein